MRKITGDTFINRNPQNGTPGTAVTADWLNAVQAELVNLATLNGQTLDTTKSDQAKTAISALLASKLTLGQISNNTATELKSMLDAIYSGGTGRTHGIRRITNHAHFTLALLQSMRQGETFQIDGRISSSLLPKHMDFPRISCLSVDTLIPNNYKTFLLYDNDSSVMYFGNLTIPRVVWRQIYIDSNRPVKVVLKKYNHGDIVPYLAGYPTANHRFFPSGQEFSGKPFQQAASFIFMVAHSTPTSYLTTTSYTESTAFTFNRLICWRAHDVLGNYASHAGSSLVTTIAWL